MGDLPLRTPTHRRLGGPLPRQLTNGTHRHPLPINLCRICHAANAEHRALILLSQGCSRVKGRFDTRYAPVRRSPAKKASFLPAAPRLACVRPVASVHPEPGSNSSLYIKCFVFLCTRTHRILFIKGGIDRDFPCANSSSELPSLLYFSTNRFMESFQRTFAVARISRASPFFPSASAKVRRLSELSKTLTQKI